MGDNLKAKSFNLDIEMKKYLAEFIGTFWLVLGGCGSAVLAAVFVGKAKSVVDGADFNIHLGISFVGVALAFGLTVLTLAYAFGHISGGHFNPAVSFGLWAGKRFPGSELLPYIIAQVLGAILAAVIIYIIASGQPSFALGGRNPLATNVTENILPVVTVYSRRFGHGSGLDLHVLNYHFRLYRSTRSSGFCSHRYWFRIDLNSLN